MFVSENLRIHFTDKLLDNDGALLCHYGIQHLSLIQLVVRLSRGVCPDDLPIEENCRISDKTGKNISMERLCNTEKNGQFSTQTVSFLPIVTTSVKKKQRGR